MKILIIHGPNLNMLGKRDQSIYGDKTLDSINSSLIAEAQELNVKLVTFQSNHEGALIDFIQTQSPQARGIVINPGALTHYGLSLRDALVDSRLPIIEIHISNIHARETFRRKSVISSIASGQISGQGWEGYLIALRTLINKISESS